MLLFNRIAQISGRYRSSSPICGNHVMSALGSGEIDTIKPNTSVRIGCVDLYLETGRQLYYANIVIFPTSIYSSLTNEAT